MMLCIFTAKVSRKVIAERRKAEAERKQAAAKREAERLQKQMMDLETAVDDAMRTPDSGKLCFCCYDFVFECIGVDIILLF